ncbi:MAG: rhodanese-like domain-containing protein [Gammaproteobacteria bacterium]|nr:rhodanese-like domain-containing protein [Gammaproteobacteria bacterium]
MSDFWVFVGNHALLFSALIAVLLLIAFNELKRKALGFKEVPPSEATRLINREDALVLDVRDDDDFEDGHIVNATHIPFALLDGRIDELKEQQSKPIILCCQNGQQSARAASLLSKHGFTSLYKLGGGMMTWKSDQMPVVSD